MTSFTESNGRSSLGRTSGDEGNPPSVAEGASNQKNEHYRHLALAGLTVILIGLCAVLAVPFLPAITWGVALAIIAWPLHRWISDRVPRPVFASLLSAAVVVVVIVVPSVFVSYQLAREATNVAVQVHDKSGTSHVRDKMAEMPFLDPVVKWMDQMDIQLEAEARKMIGLYTRDAASLAQGSFAAVIQFLVAVFILYYVFQDRGMFLRGLRDLLPLSRTESETVFKRTADSVHANLYATVITSLINTTGAGLLFWTFGVPAPLLWTVVMFFLSILPVVGAAMVWVPAVVYLMLSDQWLGGLAILGWGIACVIVVDTFLYVRLAGRGMRMHEVPALIAFLGGIAVFGLSGIILGPAILAVATAFLEVCKRRLTGDIGGSLSAPPIPVAQDLIVR